MLSDVSQDAQFILFKDDLLVQLPGDSVTLIAHLTAIELSIEHSTLVALNGELQIYSASITDSEAALIAKGFQLVSLRAVLDDMSPEMFALCGQASQHQSAKRLHRYCSRCGQVNSALPYSPVMQCQPCAIDYYPRISPCIMVLITRDDRCLLARHTRSRAPMYTALAGFVEPGESLEQTLIREVREEVDLAVNNIRYFNSQSWPFPGQQMIAFTASYLEGDISVCEEEIVDANWYHKDNLPLIPSPMTLSGQLIRHFVSSR